ncbi:MAG TPA: flagellar basal body P-ring formation chaperone FlgA [Bacteroidota bacterium]|nr:flagellar basal body P-ring formation chaperone FlgA [Bacteroidota bacterium]
MNALLSIVLFLAVGPAQVNPARIRTAVEEYVALRWAGRQEEFRLEFREVPSGINVSSPEYSLHVGLNSVPKLKGSVSLPVEIVCNGTVERRVLVSARIRTFATVAITKRLLQRHQEIGSDDVGFQRVETTTMPDDVVSRAQDLVKTRAGRIISSNSVLCRSMIERTPVIKAEDAITISVRSGKAIISVQGVAKQEGCVGDVIMVQRAGSSERLRATIQNPRTVVLEMSQFLPEEKSAD